MPVPSPAQYGPWALITGASSGIGAEFARQLAAAGFNVALVARRQQVLESLAGELTNAHNMQAKVVAVDLSTPDAAATIAAATADLEVGLLVNNAAMVTWGAFERSDMVAEANMIQANIVTALGLAHHFGSSMIQRGKGGIIFVGSTAGFAAMPYMANYMATKAYLISLGEALNYEFKDKGVDVTVLCPGGVETKDAQERAQIKQEQGMDMAALGAGMPVAPVVTETLAALGKKSIVIPGTMNSVMAGAFKHILPRGVTTRLFGSMIKKAVAEELR